MVVTVRDLRLMLAELDPSEKVGYFYGHDGTILATEAVFVKDAHDPECNCGCVSLVLI